MEDGAEAGQRRSNLSTSHFASSVSYLRWLGGVLSSPKDPHTLSRGKSLCAHLFRPSLPGRSSRSPFFYFFSPSFSASPSLFALATHHGLGVFVPFAIMPRKPFISSLSLRRLSQVFARLATRHPASGIFATQTGINLEVFCAGSQRSEQRFAVSSAPRAFLVSITLVIAERTTFPTMINRREIHPVGELIKFFAPSHRSTFLDPRACSINCQV